MRQASDVGSLGVEGRIGPGEGPVLGSARFHEGQAREEEKRRTRREGGETPMKLLAVLIGGLGIGLVLTVPAVRGGAQGAPESKPKALRAEYRTSGLLPGSRPEEGTRSAIQTITVDSDGSRLIYEERVEDEKARDGVPKREGRKFILRMDQTPPVIYEILDGGKSYREHKGDLNEYQADRRITEDQLIKSSRKLPRAEREALLKQNYLRAD